MPWNECSVVEERLRFVARLLKGESMTDLARMAPFPAHLTPERRGKGR